MPMVGSTNSHNLLYRRKNMTQLQLRSFDIPSLRKFAVGFDGMFDELMRTSQVNTNYPPYNVVKHTDDKFSIEVAVAGFKEGDITIEVENNQLFVRGEKAEDLDNEVEYLHRGISSRSFVRNWTLADHVEVINADVQDGILIVNLERKIPEEKKPKKIAINYSK